MANILVCNTGCATFAQQLEQDVAINGVTLCGANPSAEIKMLRNTLRGHFISALRLESHEGGTLCERDWKRIGALSSLRSISLHGFHMPALEIARFTNLTHLALDAATDEQLSAMNRLTQLMSLELRIPLAERQITRLSSLTNLTHLQAPFCFTMAALAPLFLVRTLSALKKVKELPFELPLTAEKIDTLFNSFVSEPKYLLKRLFSLQDGADHDLFHYCREAVGGGDLQAVMRHVDLETASEMQLLDWLDHALTFGNRVLLDDVLASPIDVNAPLPGGDRALVVAVQGDLISESDCYQYFVKRLLDMGAKPTLSDAWGRNASLEALQGHRSKFVQMFLDSGTAISRDLLGKMLDQAVSLALKNCLQDPNKAKQAYLIIKALMAKMAHHPMLTAQAERILTSDEPVPVRVVSWLLKAGARTDVPNAAQHTALKELLGSIDALDQLKSTDKALWEAKFGYLRAIIENGDRRMKSYKKAIEIAKQQGLHDIASFLEKL